MINNQLIAGTIKIAYQKIEEKIEYDGLEYRYMVTIESPNVEILEITISNPDTDGHLMYRYVLDVSDRHADKSMTMHKALRFFEQEQNRDRLVKILMESSKNDVTNIYEADERMQEERKAEMERSIEEMCVTDAVMLFMSFVYPYLDSMDYKIKERTTGLDKAETGI